MTSYHGGKQKIGKQIAKAIYAYMKKKGIERKSYIEPFCGMLGIAKFIPDYFDRFENGKNMKLGDMNKSVILMWESAKKRKPSTKPVTKTQFLRMKVDGKSSARKGFIGHVYGYHGKYFQPFKTQITKATLNRSSKKVYDIAQDLKRARFSSGPYTQFSKLRNAIIYCDPPYKIQACYYDEKSKKRSFDHDKFWNWCRKMSRYNTVFVSEYKTPNGFRKIWGDKRSKEKVFIVKEK